MTPTQEDHEAAARIVDAWEKNGRHASSITASREALVGRIAAALSDAVRDITAELEQVKLDAKALADQIVILDAGREEAVRETEKRMTRRYAAIKYADVLPLIRKVAREQGYAIGVHGSQLRDLDLIAVPWVEWAKTGEVLARTICAALEGVIVNDEKADPNDWTRRNPQPKPLGRVGWSIQLGAGLYVDLSVMSPAGTEEAVRVAVAATRARILPYGTHLGGCTWGREGVCSCGWREIRSDAQATPAPETCTHGRYDLATMACAECGRPMRAQDRAKPKHYTGPIGGTPPETGEK